MKNGPYFFFGLLSAVGIAWGGLVLGSHHQLSSLAPFYDDAQSNAFPLRPQGVAARGQLVYADLGCASCHTQQVRRPGFGADQARGWGERQSVARDYIFQAKPQLGAARIGPDLANFGGRIEKEKGGAAADSLYQFLHAGSATHPGYKFLFDEKAIDGQRSNKALAASPAGRQIVPSERAQTLVAYLLNSNTAYDYPEARPFVVAAKKEEGKK